MKIYMHIYTHVYTPLTLVKKCKLQKNIKNPAVVALFLNEAPLSVFWPKSSNAEAVSGFPLRSL